MVSEKEEQYQQRQEEPTELQKFDSYLTETAVEGVQYIKPKYVELSLSKDRKQELRALLKTLNEYGMSQRDRLFLMYIMALELESREAMTAIVDGISIADEHIPKRRLLVDKPTSTSKLITEFNQ